MYENPPKIFTDSEGNASGFWPDIIEYIAAKEGWKIEYVHGTWAECLERLERNEIDVMPDTGFTEPRSKKFAFSNETVLVSWSRVYVKEGAEIQSILDLEGKTIAGLKGSFNLDGPEGMKEIVREFDIDCTFVEMDDYIEVFKSLERKEIDAGVTNKDFGNKYQDQFDIERTPIIFQPARMQFALTKNSSLTPYLIERIDYQMKELKADDSSIYYQSLEKWFGVKPAEKPVVPGWVKWLLAGVGGLGLLFFGGSLILGSRVRSKTKELSEEITERKRAEERIKHLNLMLRAVRNINQLIVREKDVGRLLEGVCQNLVGTRGYYSAWVALLDGSGGLAAYAEAGLGERFGPVIDLLKRGGMTECGRKALAEPGVVVTENSLLTCGDCPLSSEYGGGEALTVRLEHEGEVYGLLSVSVPGDVTDFDEEISLFAAVADDIGFALYGVEIEEKYKKAEEELQRSEERYRAVFEHTGTATIIVEEDMTIFLANEYFAAQTGYSREEIEGKKKWTEFVHSEDLEVMKGYHRERRKKGKSAPGQYEFRQVDREGKTKSIFMIVGMISGTSRSVASLLDITERKQSEEELQKYHEHLEELVEERTGELREAQEGLLRAERLATLGQFSGSVSHELRNPLGVIDSSVYFLKSRLKNADEKTQEHLERIKSSVRRSTAIIESLLDLTRMKEPRAEKLDLVAVVSEAIAASKVPAAVKVVRDLPDEKVPVNADGEQLRMAFKNVIRNAAEAMDGRGTLTITIDAASGEWAEVSFGDTGPGIAPENLEKVFQPLFSTRAKGIGFGLSIVRMIIEKQAGTIEAKSEQGEGATFVIRLPLSAGEDK